MKTGDSLLISVDECATRLGINRRTVTALVMSGQWLGARKAGERYIISRAAFERHYLDGIVAEAETERHPFLRRIDLAS